MNETMTMHKWWWVWEFEKEEQWLNNMAMEGWALDGVAFCKYRFVRCEPGEYTIRMEMGDGDKDYLDFMRDLQAEYVGSVVKWHYFRRKSEFGEFEIFSDIDSKINHLSRIARMLIIIGMLNIGIGVVNSMNIGGAGAINLLCGCLLMYGLGRIHGKMDDLKTDRMLHE